MLQQHSEAHTSLLLSIEGLKAVRMDCSVSTSGVCLSAKASGCSEFTPLFSLYYVCMCKNYYRLTFVHRSGSLLQYVCISKKLHAFGPSHTVFSKNCVRVPIAHSFFKTVCECPLHVHANMQSRIHVTSLKDTCNFFLPTHCWLFVALPVPRCQS